MKKIRYPLMLAIAFIGLQSFITPNWEVAEIMQAIVDLEPMDRVWEKDDNGDILPVYLVTNDHFPEVPKFFIAGQEVKIISSEEANQLEAGIPYMDVSEFRIKKEKKARLEFKYNEVKVKVTMVKQEGNWNYRSLSITGNGITHKSVDWTF